MKKIITAGICVFSLFILNPVSVFAISYNYLPPDVLIKQQEEKSALEYRLRKLESSVSGSSSSYISTLSSRISQLESERNTEKAYITGVYGNYGIANQLESKLDEIDSKYASQISDLQSQKQEYENKLANQRAKEAEIADLISQIEKLKNQIDTNQSKSVELPVAQVPVTKIYTDIEIEKLFAYIDSLSLKDASAVYQKMRKENPDAIARAMLLYDKKYPHGKPGTATNDEYLESLQKDTRPVSPSIQKSESRKLTPRVRTPEIKQEKEIEKVVPPEMIEQKSTPLTTTEKQTFRSKIKNFFVRLFGF